jgi:hypothetical protein
MHPPVFRSRHKRGPPDEVENIFDRLAALSKQLDSLIMRMRDMTRAIIDQMRRSHESGLVERRSSHPRHHRRSQQRRRVGQPLWTSAN